MRRLILWYYDQLYTRLAWSYDLATWLASGGLWRRWIFLAERYLGESPVVEVGCGRGQLLARLAARGYPVMGVDLSPRMVHAAQDRLRTAGLPGQVLQGRSQALPFADASVGTLITTFPTAYIYDPAAQREVARVLRSTGRWIWVDAPVARQPTLRIVVLTMLGYLAGLESSVLRARGGGPVAALAAAVGLSRGTPTWAPRLRETAPFRITVEQVPVGATAVHVTVLQKV